MSRRTALVTGCRQGSIGDCIARELHRRGFRVYATARTQTSLDHYERTGIKPLILDVSDSRSIKELCTSLAEELTGLDLLINNAGVGMCSTLLDIDLAIARSVVDVNIFGPLELTKGLIRLLQETSGTIINIGSVMGRVPFWGGCIYGMSKAALEQLSRHMRTELAPFGIRVIHINGGGVQTDFFQHTTGGSLPAESPYYRARDIIGPWISGERLRSLQRKIRQGGCDKRTPVESSERAMDRVRGMGSVAVFVSSLVQCHGYLAADPGISKVVFPSFGSLMLGLEVDSSQALGLRASTSTLRWMPSST